MELLICGVKERLEGPAVGYCLLDRVETRLKVLLEHVYFHSRLDAATTDLDIAGAETVNCLDGFSVRYRDCVRAQPHELSVLFV